MGPDDNVSEAFSREYDTIEIPTPDGTVRRHTIATIGGYQTAAAERPDDWNNMFATPFMQYTGTGMIEADRGRVCIHGLDLVSVIKQLSSEEKRKVLELLLEAFTEPDLKTSSTKKSWLQNMLRRARKNDVVKSS